MTTEPAGVRLLKAHGFLPTKNSNGHAIGPCPFCGREDKFYLNVESFAWDCKVCGASGSLSSYLERVHDLYQNALGENKAAPLLEDRGLSYETLCAWRVGFLAGRYTIPVFDGRSRISDIRVYTIGKGIRSSPGGKTGIASCPTLDEDDPSSPVWLCEGEWDAMALWQVLHERKTPALVVALPGASTRPESVRVLAQDRPIRLAFDHDAAGKKATKYWRSALHGIASSIQHVAWLPDTQTGYDVRDLLQSHEMRPSGAELLETLLADDASEKEAPTSTQPSEESRANPLQPRAVMRRLRRYLYLPDEDMISILYGAVVANRLKRDPVWLFLVTPPSGGKSALLLSLEGASEVYGLSRLSAHTLVSGARSKHGDPSLAPKLDGKTLVVKDFTGVLGMPPHTRNDLFGQLRDAYDGKITYGYGSGVVRTYRTKFGLIAGTTPVIDKFQQTDLGERFLKLRYTPTDDEAREMSRRNADRTLENNSDQAALREISKRALAVSLPDRLPSVSQDAREALIDLASVVAVLRARIDRNPYSREVETMPTTEAPPRLVAQLLALGLGIAVYERRRTVDERVLDLLRRVARDSIPARVMRILQSFFARPETPLRIEDLLPGVGLPSGTVRLLVEDLELSGALERAPARDRTAPRAWRLRENLRDAAKILGFEEKSSHKPASTKDLEKT